MYISGQFPKFVAKIILKKIQKNVFFTLDYVKIISHFIKNQNLVTAHKSTNKSFIKSTFVFKCGKKDHKISALQIEVHGITQLPRNDKMIRKANIAGGKQRHKMLGDINIITGWLRCAKGMIVRQRNSSGG